MSDIDPIRFGQMAAEVDSLRREVTELRADVKALLELANQSKGGFWMGMSIAASVGGLLAWAAEHVMRMPR